MAGNPGWFVNEGDSIIELPRAENFGGLAIRAESGVSLEDNNLREETALGQTWGRARFRRIKATITFRCTEEQLEALEELDSTVDGSRLAFFFVPDVEVPSVSYQVRKEDSFLPKESADLIMIDGEPAPLWDYEMTLTGEAEMTDPEHED